MTCKCAGLDFTAILVDGDRGANMNLIEVDFSAENKQRYAAKRWTQDTLKYIADLNEASKKLRKQRAQIVERRRKNERVMKEYKIR